MKVLLISANTETINMPTLPVGLGMVAAAAESAGHQVSFLDLLGLADPLLALGQAIGSASPEVIGISIRNIDDQVSSGPKFLLEKARTVVEGCKTFSSAPVVVGGAGYSMFPESALAYLGADFGIQGEGEGAFLDLLHRLGSGADVGGVPGLYAPGVGCRTPRTFQTRLDDWPFPDPSLFDTARFSEPSCYLPFQTRRGCPLRCSYCATATIEGAQIRMRSIKRVIADLARYRAAGCRRVFFVDNTFNLPPAYAKELCKQIAATGLDLVWRAILYPGQADDELIRLMSRAGCVEVAMGFESGNERVLAAMAKRFSRRDIAETALRLGDAGISRMGFLLLGGPGETRDSVRESLEFVDTLQLEMVKLTVGLRIYPFTPLAEVARSEGMISGDDDLLRPRFYLRPELGDWLAQTVAEWTAPRAHWRT